MVLGAKLGQLNGCRKVVFNIIKDLSKEYEGKTFKAYLGILPIVGIQTPDAAQAVLTGKLKSDKPFLYAFLKPWLGHKSLLMLGGDRWRAKRKMFLQAFQTNAYDGYCDVIAKSADCLVARIEKMLKEAPDEPIRCLENVQKCALDIIGHVALGVDLGVQSEKMGNYGAYFNLLTMLVSTRIFQPWLWPRHIYKLTRDGRLFRKHLRSLESIAYAVKRRSEISFSCVFFLSSSRRIYCSLLTLIQNAVRVRHVQVIWDASSALAARRCVHIAIPAHCFVSGDSSTCAISWCIYFLGLHPDIQRKVHEEVDAVFGDRDHREYTQEDLKRLPYMECCVKESLRLCPPFPYIGKILDQDLTIDGRTLPRGVACFIIMYSLHRNPNEFDRPDEFIPERFMSEENSRRHPFSYIPFSAGPKNCIGKQDHPLKGPHSNRARLYLMPDVWIECADPE
ncbi:hypothetical protein HPB50_007595 [Hyalomma asiaticum]|uniref:Uncharacterized protein n=1 Tax=Hyalomma asiaticum TaxID=266040 RepID=A0ACB7TK57_HYAAI|nr:hypothetical protein HPB50_007595 [Hyalomma asiaticum]